MFVSASLLLGYRAERAGCSVRPLTAVRHGLSEIGWKFEGDLGRGLSRFRRWRRRSLGRAVSRAQRGGARTRLGRGSRGWSAGAGGLYQPSMYSNTAALASARV